MCFWTRRIKYKTKGCLGQKLKFQYSVSFMRHSLLHPLHKPILVIPTSVVSCYCVRNTKDTNKKKVTTRWGPSTLPGTEVSDTPTPCSFVSSVVSTGSWSLTRKSSLSSLHGLPGPLSGVVGTVLDPSYPRDLHSRHPQTSIFRNVTNFLDDMKPTVVRYSTKRTLWFLFTENTMSKHRTQI